MKANLWALTALIYALSFLGLAGRNAGPLAVALILLVYVGAALIFAPEKPRLEVRRSLSFERISSGKPVEIVLTVENKGLKLEEILLEDRVTPRVKVLEGVQRRLLTLPAGGQTRLAYTLSGERGRYKFSALTAVGGDPFGLFSSREVFPAAALLTVYPGMARLSRVAIRPRLTHGFAGPISARRPGSGVDFFGVREYQMSDSLRHVNWRISARHEQGLFTNEFEQESIADVGLILDARQQSNIRRSDANLFENSVHATASLAEIFLREGHRVGLLVYGYGIERVFPGYGAAQRERILQTLARAQTGINYVLESLDRLPTRFFPAKSQLVMVSPLLPDDISTLVRLRASGYEILLVSPDPLEFEKQGLEQAPGLEYALRLARLERLVSLRRLERAGVRIVDWRVDQPLNRALASSLAPQAPGRLRMGILH